MTHETIQEESARTGRQEGEIQFERSQGRPWADTRTALLTRAAKELVTRMDEVRRGLRVLDNPPVRGGNSVASAFD